MAPVLVGTAVASRYGDVVWWRAGLCLVVAVALQVGVNYANDYSDGVRGVDKDRRGPVRLTASGLKAPAAVKRAALPGAWRWRRLAGVALAVVVNPWMLVGRGGVDRWPPPSTAAGPSPTPRPAWARSWCFVFFGFVATCGSAYVHLERVPWLAVAASVPVGLLACAILLVNNLRDVDHDRRRASARWPCGSARPATVRLYRVTRRRVAGHGGGDRPGGADGA